MAKPRREQFRCQSDAIAPLLETSQFLRVLRPGSGSVDHCSWLFSGARILFVVATEVRQESLLIQRETWQQKLNDRRQRRAPFQRLERSVTLASPKGSGMPLSCANSCRLSKNHCEDAQELDIQAPNQAFFVSKLASMFPRAEACIASVVRKKKESFIFGCQHSSSHVVPHPVIQVPNCEKKESHLQLRVKRPTPSHTTLIQTQHQKPELCPSKNLSLSPPSFGDTVHHDPYIELWMPVPSLVCLQRSGQDGRWTDPSVNLW